MDDSQTSASGEIGSRAGVRFYRYRGVIKRYWWILAVCVALGLAYETWVILSKPMRYVSVGKLSVVETGGDDSSRMRTMDQSWYGTIIKILESPAVRERAGRNTTLQKPAFESLLGTVEISAENEKNTYLFAVTGSGQSAEFTRFYVDRIMEAFMEMRREEGRDAVRLRVEELAQQLERERALLAQAQKELDKFVDDENVPFIESQAAEFALSLSQARKDRDSLAQQINVYEHLNEGGLLKGQKPGGARSGDSKGSGADGGPDQWVQAQQELTIKEAELQRKALTWKPAHPRYQLLVEEIDRLKLGIEVLKEEADKGRAAALARLKAEVEGKDKRILELEEKARSFSKITTKHANLKGEVTRRQEQVSQTRQHLDQIQLEPSRNEILAIRQKATQAVEEDRGIVKHTLTGLIGGLLIGLLILFLLDRADDRLASSSEMIEQFSEPILGQIPDVAASRTNEGLPLLQPDDERFMFAEAFRSLRSSLIFMPNQTELKSLIVTSAIPNEGKSTLCANLGITMAAAGARVLLVDADLRRGDLAALFETDGRQGLANILRSEVPWRNCTQKTAYENLTLIPRGPVTNQSGELLLKPILPKLLAEWKSAFDLVIFNTAPILATDDTPTLAPNFDGTLMVIRASFTSARLTRNSLNALYQRQVNVLGLIMNCVDTELPDYYYYRYPKYYAA